MVYRSKIEVVIADRYAGAKIEVVIADRSVNIFHFAAFIVLSRH